MRTYTKKELILTQLKSVSVSVRFGEMNSENKKKVRVRFSVARVGGSQRQLCIKARPSPWDIEES